MNNPMMNMSNLITQFQNFMQNPAQFLLQSRLPANSFQNPAATIQQLLNSGAMSQDQLNQFQQMAKQLRSNPMFSQMFK